MQEEFTCISRSELYVLQADVAQLVQVVRGRIWLTESLRSQDFVLDAGGIHRALPGAKLLIEAEGEAWLKISPIQTGTLHEAAASKQAALQS